MSNLNVKFKKVLEDLEKNIQNKEDLEYIKVQIFNLYNMFFDEVNRMEEMSATRMETLAQSQAVLQERVEKIENVAKEGEETWVKLIGIDDQGKLILSKKDAVVLN